YIPLFFISSTTPTILLNASLKRRLYLSLRSLLRFNPGRSWKRCRFISARTRLFCTTVRRRVKADTTSPCTRMERPAVGPMRGSRVSSAMVGGSAYEPCSSEPAPDDDDEEEGLERLRRVERMLDMVVLPSLERGWRREGV